MAKRASMAHAAGIFADMSVDGPAIGTLVVIVDRAKNLPNRKTMGKQNPYCAARLGKEAKKTETDLRGGQTPRWDQELRYTVHESPDYFKLKVSVFNDDKKTDLIGETMIDLKPLIIPGGSQNDHWHPLQYRAKYAGEVRLEMTYYDTRPEDEAVIERRTHAAEKVYPRKTGFTPVSASSVSSATSSGVSGPRQLKDVKRRPLPAGHSYTHKRELADIVPLNWPMDLADGPTVMPYLPPRSPHTSDLSSPVAMSECSSSGIIYGEPPVDYRAELQRLHPDFKMMQPRVEDFFGDEEESLPPPPPPVHRDAFPNPMTDPFYAPKEKRPISLSQASTASFHTSEYYASASSSEAEPPASLPAPLVAGYSPPYGPDSFNSLNPGHRALRPRPAQDMSQAMVVTRRGEVEATQEAGPIIGDDGREIDPSDFLPTETWAPEPERKTKKKPGVVVRFRSPVHREIPPVGHGHTPAWTPSSEGALSPSSSSIAAHAYVPPPPPGDHMHTHPAPTTAHYGHMDGNLDALNRELSMIDIGSGRYEDRGVKRYTLSYVSR
ncbi:hypothetical protein BO70DRAFT_358396 [Aspergillus heteromorphus CBS 117.55]|uniref:C2 domain-containing protein n=1 Tax=Aspergillus heteromorphus CBS 117.55 TaxID=1448321 RepID=A0A317WWY9_9EURO|nr:uncharacterized protein BO70DRAFT_358396 [Aspergillus heteromorphus CBS 117.55]PWY90926.1 hypothetical protein BO70DRAFT_358396 [Aspergillus heteromorphus CBS 117.55]